MNSVYTRERGPEAVASAQHRPPDLAARLVEAEQHVEIFRAAWTNANESIGKLHRTLEARRLALDYAENERLRLVAAVALWRRRYRRSWGAVALISAYAGAVTLWLLWAVLR